jgi:hypothetical protein
LRILGIPALQLFYFSCGHRIPVVEVSTAVETTIVPSVGGTVRVVGDPRCVNC